MKTNKTKTRVLAALALLGLAAGAVAEEATGAAQAGKPAGGADASAAFERMKSLVGTWEGRADMGEGPVEMTVEYRLIAAGSVLEERSFPGKPEEMVTMYYQKDGKLALTHYCVMGNRPQMVLSAADGDVLTFEFDESCGIDVAKESHMHALTVRFEGADKITASCQPCIDGKVLPPHSTTLNRVAD